MSTRKDGGPAFARPAGSTGPCSEAQYNHAQQGLSLRDYLAAHAPLNEWNLPVKIDAAAEYLGIDPSKYKCEIHWPRVIAKASYEYADAMIAQRVK
jgi:hypothetical protein